MQPEITSTTTNGTIVPLIINLTYLTTEIQTYNIFFISYKFFLQSTKKISIHQHQENKVRFKLWPTESLPDIISCVYYVGHLTSGVVGIRNSASESDESKTLFSDWLLEVHAGAGSMTTTKT